MNKSDDVLTMGEILFSFVTTFFSQEKTFFCKRNNRNFMSQADMKRQFNPVVELSA